MEASSPYHLRWVFRVIKASELLARLAVHMLIVSDSFFIGHLGALAWWVVGALKKNKRQSINIKSESVNHYFNLLKSVIFSDNDLVNLRLGV